MPRGGPRPECTVAGCSKPNKAHGLCGAHYRAKRLAEKTEGPICSVDGCEAFALSRGMCMKHYDRMYRTGSTEIREDWKMRTSNASYSSWKAMLSRCENPNNASYPRYGGRGIKVCDRWHRYLDFIEDMGERPINMTLERIDNEKGYEPSNCRWASKKEQGQNKRNVTLTMDIARKVRATKAATGMKNADLARTFRIAPTNVGRILRNEIWREDGPEGLQFNMTLSKAQNIRVTKGATKLPNVDLAKIFNTTPTIIAKVIRNEIFPE